MTPGKPTHGPNPPGKPKPGQTKRALLNHSGARLRWLRVDAGWTPGQLATLIRQAGRDLGRPNRCNAQMVREWEDGALADCDPLYRNALGKVTGIRFDLLCSPWAKFAPTPEMASMAATPEKPPLPGVPFRILLRQWRMKKRLSQSELADLIQRFGASIGEHNACTKRLVQKWESGEHATVNANYVRLLNKLTGIPTETLNSHRIAPLPNTMIVPPDSVLELIDRFLGMLNELRIKVITGLDAESDPDDDTKEDDEPNQD